MAFAALLRRGAQRPRRRTDRRSLLHIGAVMRFLVPSIVLASFLMGAAAPAAAQAPEERVTVNFTPAFATIGGDTELALAGLAGYRFSDHLWFEGDFTWIDGAAGSDRDLLYPFGSGQLTTVPVVGNVTGGVVGGVIGGVTEIVSRTPAGLGAFDLRRFPRLPNIPIPVEGFDLSNDGRTIIATLGVRYEPTVQTARFRPYVSGGLGLNHTEQEILVSIGTATPTIEESISHSGFAFSAGGGASIRLFNSLWVNADAKYFRLSRDRNLMRLGGGIGLRF
jgi:opacity protein-like surface antigen